MEEPLISTRPRKNNPRERKKGWGSPRDHLTFRTPTDCSSRSCNQTASYRRCRYSAARGARGADRSRRRRRSVGCRRSRPADRSRPCQTCRRRTGHRERLTAGRTRQPRRTCSPAGSRNTGTGPRTPRRGACRGSCKGIPCRGIPRRPCSASWKRHPPSRRKMNRRRWTPR